MSVVIDILACRDFTGKGQNEVKLGEMCLSCVVKTTRIVVKKVRAYLVRVFEQFLCLNTEKWVQKRNPLW